MMNNILVLVDFSYLCYVVAYNAMSHFEKNYSDEFHAMIHDPEETDQNNLPNPLTSSNFKRELSKSFQNKLQSIDWILRDHFQPELDFANKVDYVLAVDSSLLNSFRKKLYPEYKAQRKLTKKAYNFGNVRDYLLDIFLPDLNKSLSNKYLTVKVDGAEGDDIIAIAAKNLNDYNLKIVIGSDRDLLQISNIRLFDIFGEEKLRVAWKDGPLMTPSQYLLKKIITGDGSDNISSIKPKYGEKKAYKFAIDTESFEKFLKENVDASEKYQRNKKLMSFDMIPQDLENKIMEEILSKISIVDNKKVETQNAFEDSLINIDDL